MIPDGLIGDGSPYEEIWGLERIEVVKGPASTLFGQGPLGGFVNLVSKRPRPDFFGEVQFTAGSFNYYQGALDVNFPANKNKTIYARLNALIRDSAMPPVIAAVFPATLSRRIGHIIGPPFKKSSQSPLIL